MVHSDALEAQGIADLSKDDCLAAIHGKRVPKVLGPETARICVVRGIRYHDGFATDLHGTAPEFTRALNARAIMSNRIPEMASYEECAYCIWHPETATEETYRRLARKYPQLRYQVGRACAIAGYKKLYSELDLLSDISIAEEARESGSADIFDSADIYRMIIAQSPFYKVLDDYTRTVNLDDPKEVTGINCDTAVRSSLDVKQPLTDLTLPLTGDLFR